MRCEVWGVVNVTPDSFSDGGQFLDPGRAVAHGLALLASGADVLDVGGESSRPPGAAYGSGFERVTAEEEARRVVPVVARLAGEHGARVSVDTVKASVAAQALEAGAALINDVSGECDPALIEVVARHRASLVLMHNRGRGEVSGENTQYDDVVAEVGASLLAAVERAVAGGVGRDRVWIDPGIGFAKTARQSLQLLANTHHFARLGYPVLVGPSRKAFIAEAAVAQGAARPAAGERLLGTAAAVTAAVMGGAAAVRVHDVADLMQAVQVARAIAELGAGGGAL